MPELPAASGGECRRPKRSSLASLKSTRGFIALYKHGKWVHGPSLSLGWLSNDEGQSRLGIRTRKGLKGAVVRNRLKRQLRAALRESGFVPRQQIDVLLVLHPRQERVRTELLKKELCALVQTARLV